jgi:diguanylate cyclase (GGDEF)-like protein
MLQQFANCLSDSVRAGDSVGRLGGDEFAVIIGVKKYEDIDIAVARIRAGLRVRDLDAAIGVAVYPVDAPDAESLIRAADTEMYQAKRLRSIAG